MTHTRAVIVFDGICVLCNGWVRFLLRYDRRSRYRFATMQSALKLDPGFKAAKAELAKL